MALDPFKNTLGVSSVNENKWLNILQQTLIISAILEKYIH